MTNSGPIIVATIVPAPGCEQKVEAALLAAVAATHEQDTGCELYAAHRTVRGGEGFVMIEKWASSEALQQHAAGAAFQALTQALDGLLAQPISVTVLSPMAAGQDDLGRL